MASANRHLTQGHRMRLPGFVVCTVAASAGLGQRAWSTAGAGLQHPGTGWRPPQRFADRVAGRASGGGQCRRIAAVRRCALAHVQSPEDARRRQALWCARADGRIYTAFNGDAGYFLDDGTGKHVWTSWHRGFPKTNARLLPRSMSSTIALIRACGWCCSSVCTSCPTTAVR